jgi:hypothetical protein
MRLRTCPAAKGAPDGLGRLERTLRDLTGCLASSSEEEVVMRVIHHPDGRLLGYVEVKVASQVYRLPVEGVPFASGTDSPVKPGFVSRDREGFGIVVDSNAPDGEQRQTIERASVEAARFISAKLLN